MCHWRSSFTFCQSEPVSMVLCSFMLYLLSSPFLILFISFPNLRKNVCVHAKLLQSCLTTCDPMDCSLPGSLVHGDSPGKNTRVGCQALLQGIFPTQGSNLQLLCLLHWQVGSLPLAPPGKPLRKNRSHKWTIT